MSIHDTTSVKVIFGEVYNGTLDLGGQIHQCLFFLYLGVIAKSLGLLGFGTCEFGVQLLNPLLTEGVDCRWFLERSNELTYHVRGCTCNQGWMRNSIWGCRVRKRFGSRSVHLQLHSTTPTKKNGRINLVAYLQHLHRLTRPGRALTPHGDQEYSTWWEKLVITIVQSSTVIKSRALTGNEGMDRREYWTGW